MPQQVGDKKYKRILLKLSGEALTGQENFGIDPKILDRMALESASWSALACRLAWWLVGGICSAAQPCRPQGWTVSRATIWVCWPPS